MPTSPHGRPRACQTWRRRSGRTATTCSPVFLFSITAGNRNRFTAASAPPERTPPSGTGFRSEGSFSPGRCTEGRIFTRTRSRTRLAEASRRTRHPLTEPRPSVAAPTRSAETPRPTHQPLAEAGPSVRPMAVGHSEDQGGRETVVDLPSPSPPSSGRPAFTPASTQGRVPPQGRTA